MRHFLLQLVLLSFLISSAHCKTLIRTLAKEPKVFVEKGDLFCDSWRLSVETNNAGPWKIVPKKCIEFMKRYMNGHKWSSNCKVVAEEALAFAETVEITGDGKDVWVFDIDETLLSNLHYYRLHGYGSEAYNSTAFDEWVYLGKAPALPASLKLYKELQGLGFQLVLLTGRDEPQRNITEANLRFAGYSSWERLILRGDSDAGVSAVNYKSGKRANLVAQGYRIHGCSGDQWSDLFGSPMATRSFKIPNPMYYIG